MLVRFQTRAPRGTSEFRLPQPRPWLDRSRTVIWSLQVRSLACPHQGGARVDERRFREPEVAGADPAILTNGGVAQQESTRPISARRGCDSLHLYGHEIHGGCGVVACTSRCERE